MSSLTPLHFTRKTVNGERVVSYGSSFYITDCHRFILNLEGGRWFVWSVTNHWYNWCGDVGIRHIPFHTRQEALRALKDVLDTEGLLDAATP